MRPGANRDDDRPTPIHLLRFAAAHSWYRRSSRCIWPQYQLASSSAAIPNFRSLSCSACWAIRKRGCCKNCQFLRVSAAPVFAPDTVDATRGLRSGTNLEIALPWNMAGHRFGNRTGDTMMKRTRGAQSTSGRRPVPCSLGAIAPGLAGACAVPRPGRGAAVLRLGDQVGGLAASDGFDVPCRGDRR